MVSYIYNIREKRVFLTFTGDQVRIVHAYRTNFNPEYIGISQSRGGLDYDEDKVENIHLSSGYPSDCPPIKHR